MIRLRLVAVLSVAVALGFGCDTGVQPTNPYDPDAPPDKQAPAALQGDILGAADQSPLEGAEVSLEGPTVPGESPLTTGPEGTYSFRELIPGRYVLTVRHPGHFEQSRAVGLQVGEERTLDVTLVPLPDDVTEDSGHLTGEILKAGQLNLPADEQDHSGIVVEIGSAAIRTITNRAGVFDLFVSPGTYTISLQAADHRSQTISDVVVPAMTVTTLPGSPITLEPNPGRVSGLVALEGLSDPDLGGTQVSLLGSQSTTTAADGSFLIADVAPGVYTLQISRDDYDTQHVASVVVQGGRESVLPEVDLVRSRGTIVGNVQLEGAASHEGVVLELVGNGATAVSNSAGDFIMPGVVTGVFELRAQKVGWLTASVPTVTVAAGETVDVGTIDLDINPGTVEGRVTLEGEQLHDGITVTLNPGSLSATTAADGTFYINDVVQGAYTLVATADGFANATASLLVSPGQTTTVPDLELTIPRGSVAGTVQVEEGGPEEFQGVRVDLFNPDYSDTTFVLADGSYAFSDVPVGTFSLVARLNGYVQDQVSGIVVNEGGTASPRVLVLRKSTGGFLICPPARPCGARFTTETGVSLQLDDDGGLWTSMRLSEDPTFTVVNPGDQPYVAFDANPPFTLSGTDGEKVVYAQYKDDLDNESDVLSASIVLDTAPPHSASVVINNGAGYTNNTLFQLTLAAVDDGSGVAEMKISEDANFDDDSWIGFDDVRSHPTSPGAPPGGDGLKVIRVIFRDAAGNEMLPGAAVQDDITLDRVPPVLNAITLDCDGVPDADTCSSPVVSISIDPPSQAPDTTVAMAFSNTGSFSAATFVGFDTPVSWLLTPGDGLKTVSAMLRDAAGNESAGVATDTITIDTTAPAAGTISLAGGAAYTNSATVALQVTGEAGSEVELTGTLAEAGVYTLAGLPADITLTGPDGVKEVQAVVIDPAGNRSLPFSTGIVLDRQPPYAASVIIDGGAEFTTDATGEVALALTAADVTSGVDRIQITSNGSFSGVPEEPFVLNRVYTLDSPGTEEVKTVEVRFYDLADNYAEATAEITLDYTPPTFTAAIAGQDVPPVANRTALRTVDLTLSNIAGAPTAMMVSNQAGFGDASWIPVASGDWDLSGGDGTKTVHVKLRDAAGNESAVAQPQIELDTTGPETPAIQVADIDGDGFALSATEVELEWSVPADGDLAGYKVQRLIAGVDVSFQDLVDLGAGTNQHEDLNAIPGSPHSYRVRAVDDLGNVSGWSASAVAWPFEPITSVDKVRAQDTIYYEFFPAPGAFWLQAAYAWEELDGTPSDEVLPINRPYFERVFDPDRFNESLSLKVWNQDSSLVYESVVPLRNNERIVLSDEPRGDSIGLVTDPAGVTHAAYIARSGAQTKLHYANDASGKFDVLFNDPSADCADVALDAQGVPHIAYIRFGTLFHATNASGSWQTEQADIIPGGNGADYNVAIDIDDLGSVHICWRDRVATNLRYTTNASGVFVSEVVDADRDVGSGCDISVDSSRTVHISYVQNNDRSFRVASGQSGGPWSIDDAFVVPVDEGVTGLAVDPADNLHVVYGKNNLRYATNASGSWVVEPLGIFVDFGAIAIDPNGQPIIAHDETSAGNAGFSFPDGAGGWTTRWVDTWGDTGQQIRVDVDRFGAPHLIYRTEQGPLMYAVDRSVAVFDELVEDNGIPERRSALALDGDGRPRVVFHEDIGDLRVASATGLGWTYENIDSGRFRQPEIQVDDDGALRILYSDVANQRVIYADNTSGSWAFADLAERPGTGELYASHTVDSNGHAHFMYCQREPVDRVYYATDASGSWVGSDVVSLTNYPTGCPIHVDESGTVHTVYYTTDTNQLTYVEGTPGNWSATAIDTYPNGNLHDLGLDLDPSGAVHVIYWKGNNRMYHATNLSGAWEINDTGFDMLDADPASIEMVVDEDGYVHVIMGPTNLRITYVTNRFGDWREYSLAIWDNELLPGGEGGPSLAIDRWGQLFLSFVSYTDADGLQVRLLKDFMAKELMATTYTQTAPF